MFSSLTLSRRLPLPKLPRFDYFGAILSDSLIIAVVSFAVALSLGKTFAKKHGYSVRANQEFAALGTANIVSSFFLCFPATASLSRTSGRETASSRASLVLNVFSYYPMVFRFFPRCLSFAARYQSWANTRKRSSRPSSHVACCCSFCFTWRRR